MRYIFLGMLAFSGACSDEVIPPVPGSNGGKEKEIPLIISLKDLSLPASTYGTNYPGETPADGSAWENQINDITVYIFDQSFHCEKIVQATTSPTNAVMIKTGNKNIVAVVNAAGKMTLPTSEATTNYPSLLKMLTDASATVPTSPFLMTGKLLNVALPDELPSVSPYNLTIDVERATAKVKMKVMKSGLASSHSITLTRIIMVQGADRVALLETPSPNPTTYLLSDTAKVFQHTTTNVFSGDVPNTGNGYCAMADSFYTYESMCGSDKSKAVKIILESYVNSPANTRKAEFYLGEYSATPGDTVYDVKRNYWYDVTVNFLKPGMDSIYVTVNVSRWNVADTIKVVEGDGGEFTTAVPFKLVKNYTSGDIALNSEIAAIDNHTKGASWIDMKITDGTVWSLQLKDPSASRNQGVIGSIDNGQSWSSFPISNTGGDTIQRVYIYRPYVENNEPKLGPALYVTLNGQYKQDFVIQPRDTTPIPTNCYILRPQLTAPVNETRAYIPLAGVYKYWEDYILENGDSIPFGDVSAELLWDDSQTGNVVKNISVTNKSKRDSAYIYAEAGISGNAVIAMKVGGNIYWSFHIWVTEYNPYESAGQKLYKSPSPPSPPIKNVFMDRDLGAMNNTYDADGKVRGLFYQFGRKDPFPGGSVSWGSTFAWYNASGTLISLSSASVPPALSPVTDLRPLNAIPASINSPMTFYTRSGATDWSLSVENEFLWSTQGGNKTAFDPCPEGWRVPKQLSYGELSSPWNGVGFATGYTNGRYNATVGYYPYSGYIGTSTSAITSATTISYYWTSLPGASSQYQGTGLFLSTGSTNMTSLIDKAYGASVRCVVDLNYLLSKERGGLFGSGAGALEEELLP
jgi:uncharacterized protein (TIGR02145 family)